MHQKNVFTQYLHNNIYIFKVAPPANPQLYKIFRRSTCTVKFGLFFFRATRNFTEFSYGGWGLTLSGREPDTQKSEKRSRFRKVDLTPGHFSRQIASHVAQFKVAIPPSHKKWG